MVQAVMNETRAMRRSLDQLTVSHHAGPSLAALLRLCRCFVGICANFGRSRSETVEDEIIGEEEETRMKMLERRADDVTSSLRSIVAILITTTWWSSPISIMMH